MARTSAAPPTPPGLRLRPFAAFLSALVLFAACSAPTEQRAVPEPAKLSLYIGDILIGRFSSLGMLPGDSLHFSVHLTDAGGRVVNGLHSNLVSRNALAVTLDSTGVARVAGRGSSWIVGSVLTPAHNVLADSTLVNVVCTTDARPGVRLTVVDSVTGQSGPMRSLKVVIRTGTLRDTAFVTSIAAGAPLFSFAMAFERKGTYDLDVTADGFQPWARSAVTVTGDICHVTTVAITARLQPQ
jgi:hypothetical protein